MGAIGGPDGMRLEGTLVTRGAGMFWEAPMGTSDVEGAKGEETSEVTVFLQPAMNANTPKE
jgi:hypothetical protein